MVSTGSGTGYTYEWLDEEYLASWLHQEHVVEAVLGDPDPSNTASANSVDTPKERAKQVMIADLLLITCEDGSMMK